MSWYANVQVAGDADDEDIAHQVAGASITAMTDGADAEVQEQLHAAAKAAADLISSDAMGDSERYAVSVSGHANPGHADREGYANDAITVSVARVSPPAEPEADEPKASAGGAKLKVAASGEVEPAGKK